MTLATNAYKIVQLRANGYRPDEMILVSLVGKLDESNHTVFADQKTEYDWRWCKGLDICVFASSAVRWLDTVQAIYAAMPHYLSLWDIDRKQGAEFHRWPVLDGSQWRFEMRPDAWIPMQNAMFEGDLCS